MTKKDKDKSKANSIVTIAPRKPIDWMKLIHEVEENHWHTFRIVIQMREWLLAGKPAQLDAAEAMVAARAKKLGIEPTVQALREERMSQTTRKEKEEIIEETRDEGLCEFHRRPNKEGIWLPSNNIKAGLKENWTAQGFTQSQRGSRGRLAELTFVRSVPPPDSAPIEWDWVYLGEAPYEEIHTAIAQTTGPSGRISAIKRHEYVVQTELTFDIVMAERAFKELSPKLLATTLVHFSEHGLGACRSQGYGKFDILDMQELKGDAPVLTAVGE